MVRALALALALVAGLAHAGTAAPPRRVLSMNLCTDQLAMLLAAPGQLVSVSWLAQDPLSSSMVAQARRLPANHASAEEVFLTRPDLVLAGAWTAPETLRLLRHLGVPVAVFPIESDIAGIRANITRMGDVLGREAQASALLAEFDADLAALHDAAPGPRPRAALYAANGYSSGSDSLGGQIIALAGFDNLADEMGIRGTGNIALEQLLLARPDLVIRDRPARGHSRAEDLLDHPGLQALAQSGTQMLSAGPEWVCGTPHVLHAVAELRAARLRQEPEP
ncbi:ABC transporter substrate-binding protein [Paracoccus sp. (in: a-proteobacteria)]|uniref:ABC transporter substrate-binding protein n=1 Tax=Paracoccus sp. TaxID=267 RepID=UPI00322055BE